MKSRWWILAFVLLAVGVGALPGCGGPDALPTASEEDSDLDDAMADEMEVPEP